MENIRLTQAQSLIEKTAGKNKKTLKLKNPKAGHIDSKKFENIFKNIISAEEFLYSSLPFHNLSKEEAKKLTDYLISAKESIDSILYDFKVINKEEKSIDMDQLTSKYLFITTKNSFKKILKNLGIDVARIIVTGVPLNIMDMKEINPKIPENALKGIEKKIEHAHNDIQRKIEALNPEKIFVLAEEDTNGILLKKRASEQYSANSYLNNNLKDLTENDFIEFIEN